MKSIIIKNKNFNWFPDLASYGKLVFVSHDLHVLRTGIFDVMLLSISYFWETCDVETNMTSHIFVHTHLKLIKPP